MKLAGMKEDNNLHTSAQVRTNMAPSSAAKGPKVKFANVAKNGETPREQVILHAAV